MNISACAGFACVLGLVFSCSDSKSDAAGSPSDATQIGNDGGTVEAGKASVEVPKGALSSATKIGIAASEVDVAPPDGYILVGAPIAFTPHGLTFDKPVTLTLPYSSSSDALTVLRLENEDDTTWDVIKGGVFADGSATVDVSTFSIYAVAAASAPDGAAGAGGQSASEGGTASTAGAPTDSAGGAPGSAAGAPSTGVGDVTWSCDRADTDGNGLHICSDYFYPAMVAKLLGDKLVKGCPGAGNGVLLDACPTAAAVVGCLMHDVDGIPGVTVLNWFYMGNKADIAGGILCSKAGTEIIDPP